MGPVGRVLGVCLLLLAAGWSLAQSPDGPPDYQLLRGDPEEGIAPQNCWECHKPGAYPRPMVPYIALAPDILDFPAGPSEPLDLVTQVANVWAVDTQNQYEQKWFRVTLDISDAPSMSFVSDTPPYSGSASGAIPIDPTLVLSDPTYLTLEHTGVTTIQIPDGATSVDIQILPDDQDSNTGADIAVDLYPGRTDAEGDPYLSVDAAGKGGGESLSIAGNEFGVTGYGNWTLGVRTTLLDQNGPAITPALSDIGYTVQVAALFESSALTQMVQASDAVLEKGQRTLMNWPLQVGTPGPDEVLRFTLNFTIYYKHDSQPDDSYDWRDLSETFVIPIESGPSGYRIGSEEAIIVPVAGPGGISIARVSEVIGYIGAFLLISSVWTGGMFGKASRRQLNTIFGSARRRVAFHNFLSYGIIAFALVHMIIFLWDVGGPLAVDGYHWVVGLLLGGPAIVAMLLLGVTGALQVPMIRKWNYATWRWIHFGLAIAAIVFTIVHMLLDGNNFGAVQDWVDYRDPLLPDHL